MADLRDARAHLEQLSADPVGRAEEHAIHSIDEAIGDLKGVAIDDGKGIRDNKPVDAHLVRTDRHQYELELLDKAKQDVSREEGQADTRDLQARIVHHIDVARPEARRVIETVLNHG